jgi:replicative DNA helicase
VPVIALAQLNRAAEGREDRRPLLADLRESGTIEQDADAVLLLYRDEYYHPETESPGICEVIVAKNRTGPTGTVELAFLKTFTRFENLAHAGCRKAA